MFFSKHRTGIVATTIADMAKPTFGVPPNNKVHYRMERKLQLLNFKQGSFTQ